MHSGGHTSTGMRMRRIGSLIKRDADYMLQENLPRRDVNYDEIFRTNNIRTVYPDPYSY